MSFAPSSRNALCNLLAADVARKQECRRATKQRAKHRQQRSLCRAEHGTTGHDQQERRQHEHHNQDVCNDKHEWCPHTKCADIRGELRQPWSQQLTGQET